MNAAAAADALRWLDRGPSRTRTAAAGLEPRRRPAIAASSRPNEPGVRNLRELRSRGGVIGLTPGLPGCETAEELKSLVELIAGIPFEGRELDRRDRHRQRPAWPGAAPAGPGIGPRHLPMVRALVRPQDRHGDRRRERPPLPAAIGRSAGMTPSVPVIGFDPRRKSGHVSSAEMADRVRLSPTGSSVTGESVREATVIKLFD